MYTNINTHNIHTLESTSKLQVSHSVHSVSPHQHTKTSNSRLFVGVANSIPLVGVDEEVTKHHLTVSSHLTLCLRVRLYPIPCQVWNFACLHSCLSNKDETDFMCLPQKAKLKKYSITHCTRQDIRREVREGNLHWDDSQSNPKTQSRTKCVCDKNTLHRKRNPVLYLEISCTVDLYLISNTVPCARAASRSA